MATCKECFHYELCKCVGTIKLYPGKSDGCKFMTDRAKWVEQKQTMTNAERIRTMSNEELASFMFEAPAVPCDEKISRMMKENNCADCLTCIQEWLQQPAGCKYGSSLSSN